MLELPRCLACGATDLFFWAHARDVEYFTTDETFRYLRCPNCNSLSINPSAPR